MRLTGSFFRSAVGTPRCTAPKGDPGFGLPLEIHLIPNGIALPIPAYHYSVPLPLQGTFGTGNLKKFFLFKYS